MMVIFTLSFHHTTITIIISFLFLKTKKTGGTTVIFMSVL